MHLKFLLQSKLIIILGTENKIFNEISLLKNSVVTTTIFAAYKAKTLYKVYRKGHCSILSFHGKFSMAFLNHPHAHCILTYISRMIICPIDHLCPLELTFDVLRSVAEIYRR